MILPATTFWFSPLVLMAMSVPPLSTMFLFSAVVLMKHYPAHVPPIKPLQHMELRPGKSPLDRNTGQPAMVLSVDALIPEDETVEAIGKWFAGDAVTGFYTFKLKKNGEEWHIESVK